MSHELHGNEKGAELDEVLVQEVHDRPIVEMHGGTRPIEMDAAG